MYECKYSLRPGVQIIPFDNGDSPLTVQISGNGRRIAVNDQTASVFEFLRCPRSKQEVEKYAEEHLFLNGQALPAVLEAQPFNGFVQSSGACEKDSVPVSPTRYLTLKYDLLPTDLVVFIARKCEFLFEPAVAFPVLVLVGLLHLYFVFSGEYKYPYTISFTSGQWIAAWIGAYAALLFHEIGHCSACTRYGSRPGKIGIGLYLIWPVLYADTTESWALKRRHRAVVDVAGMYFHLIVSGACILAAQYFSSPVLLVVSKSAILSTVLNLNPFFRFDGYWLLTDITGIPNIRRAAADFWNFMFRMIKNRAAARTPPQLLRVAPQLQVFFGVYCVASALFFANITIHLFRMLPPRLLRVPDVGTQMWHVVASHPMSFSAGKAVFVFVLFLLGLSQTVLFAGRRALRGYRGIRSLASRLGSPQLVRRFNSGHESRT
jgi:putative peptide zinc metalloprotease protein